VRQAACQGGAACQRFLMLGSARYSSFVEASSVGKCPRVLRIFPELHVQALDRRGLTHDRPFGWGYRTSNACFAYGGRCGGGAFNSWLLVAVTSRAALWEVAFHLCGSATRRSTRDHN
jgi:hypothetical protein